jgi:aspartyl/asparaginyl beta-hydroxylase (cupin superfamily)
MIKQNTFKYKLSRLFCKSIIRVCEFLFKRYSDIKIPDFDNELKENFEIIKSEYKNYINTNNIPITNKLSEEQYKIESQNNWKTLILKLGNYYNNKTLNFFPKTIQIIKKYKNIVYMSFSIMEPNTHIRPHRGLYNGLIRYHLGVIVPKNDNIYLKINNQIIRWEEKKSFIFDDTFIHEAVNISEEKRTIIIIDFYRPLPILLHLLNKLILFIISKSPIIKNIIENIES